MACEELGRALVADCAVWRDPQFQRSSHVRSLRIAIRQWAREVKRQKCADVDLSKAIHACAQLEQGLNHPGDVDSYQCNQDQINSLLGTAEAILAVEEMRSFMVQRNKAALEASLLLYGSKGVIPKQVQMPPQHSFPMQGPGQCQDPRLSECKPIMKFGWQPRWQGDVGDPFEPYQQLIEQYLHSALSYHTRALEHLSASFAAVKKSSQNARDFAYIRTLAAAAGISVKEYQRLLDMFHKIDRDGTGRITKRDLMGAMKRDKDIAAFMQLSRAKNQDGRRESFESVFNRIDNTGMGAITWEQFLYFFSSGRSLIGDPTHQRPCSPGRRPCSPGRM